MPLSAADRRRLRGLGIRGMVQLGAAGVALPVLRLSISKLGVKRTAKGVRSTTGVLAGLSPNRNVTPTQDLYERIAIAGRRGPVGATCLPQSMLLWSWLTARGDAPCLRIGIGEGGALLQAHAWVDLADHRYGYGEQATFDGFDLMRWAA